MPRRRRAVIREVAPDPVYNSTLVEKFVNSMMWDGKKNTSQRIFYVAMDKIRERTADVAAVPAGVDDAAEEDSECDEAEPPELGMVQAARPGGRPALLDPARSPGAQLALALLARHAGGFRRAAAPSFS